MRAQMLTGLRTLLVLTVLTGIVYPLAVLGVAQLAFNDKANGSLVERDGAVVGSSLLGQAFTGPAYFHTRPSAAGAAASGSLVDGLPADPADLSLVASGASNLGPTNEDLLAAVEGAGGGLPGGEPPAGRRAGPGGRRDRLWLGARPPHLGGQRRAPGASRRRRARPAARGPSSAS